MKKIFFVMCVLGVVISFLAGCAAQKSLPPSICGEAAFKKVDLRAWAKEKYEIDTKVDGMVLCDIANDRGIALEATGDLFLVMDTVAVRANAYKRTEAIRVFEQLKRTFLSAARGSVILNVNDLRWLAYDYAGQYPELAIALKYTDIFQLPEYSGRIPTALDFIALAWWCDQNLDYLSRLNVK